MKEIDYSDNDRVNSFNNFIHYSNPTFSVTVRMDVTSLFKRCKEGKRSFFIEFLYHLTKVANGQECFRTRIKNGKVVLYERIDTAYFVLNRNNALVPCFNDFVPDRDLFYRTVRETIDAKKEDASVCPFSETRNDLIYVSSTPWMDFVSITNSYDFNDMDNTSIPRIAWGKVVQEGDRYRMSLNISVHHSLMDGYQVSLLIDELQNEINRD